jgi:hypothetical protein
VGPEQIAWVSFSFFTNTTENQEEIFKKNNKSMEKSRLRINNEVASYVLRNGDWYVRYLGIKVTTALLADGVHLNELGSNILLNTITGALETFAKAYKLPDGCGGMTYRTSFIRSYSTLLRIL